MRSCGLTNASCGRRRSSRRLPAAEAARRSRFARRARRCAPGASRRHSITSAASRTPTPRPARRSTPTTTASATISATTEINRGFEMARALGAEIITASTTLSVARRVVPFAEKHKMAVAVHNHSNTKDPNEFATPESFRRRNRTVEVLQGQSRHRPLHRRQLRPGRVPARASRRHHEPAPQGSEEGSGRQHAVGHRRHEDSRSPRAAQAREVADPRLHRIRISWREWSGRRGEGVPGLREECARMTQTNQTSVGPFYADL